MNHPLPWVGFRTFCAKPSLCRPSTLTEHHGKLFRVCTGFRSEVDSRRGAGSPCKYSSFPELDADELQTRPHHLFAVTEPLAAIACVAVVPSSQTHRQ